MSEDVAQVPAGKTLAEEMDYLTQRGEELMRHYEIVMRARRQLAGQAREGEISAQLLNVLTSHSTAALAVHVIPTGGDAGRVLHHVGNRGSVALSRAEAVRTLRAAADQLERGENVGWIEP